MKILSEEESEMVPETHITHVRPLGQMFFIQTPLYRGP
jgi:hypothetical protein